VPNGPSERLREAQKSSYNPSFKTDRFCYQTSKQLLHFVVRSVSVHFGGLPSSSDVRLPHSFSSIWIDRRRARAHLSVSETRLDRQASSESAFQHSGNAFGSTGVERERISALPKCIWVDRRRAGAHLSVSERHLDRQASCESAFQDSGNAVGSTGVDRERRYARRELYLYCFVQQSDGPCSLDKTSTFYVLLTPDGVVFDDPIELLRHARTRFRSTKTVLVACEQFMKNVWHCTRNGFSARKLPAERSQEPKVLYPVRAEHAFPPTAGC